jgi:hypothetical protein
VHVVLVLGSLALGAGGSLAMSCLIVIWELSEP